MKLTDEMLYQYAAEARELWLSSFPNTKEEVPEHRFSRKFEKKMTRLLKEQRRSSHFNAVIRYAQRAAVFILILISVTFAGVMSVEAYRTAIIDTVSQIFEDYTHFHFFVDESAGETVFQEAVFRYLPTGMTQVNSEKYDYSYAVSYSDADGRFLAFEAAFINENTDFQMGIDTEDADVEHFYVLGERATVSHKRDWTIIVWTHKNTVYSLRGNVTPEEGKKIVESAEYQEFKNN